MSTTSLFIHGRHQVRPRTRFIWFGWSRKHQVSIFYFAYMEIMTVKRFRVTSGFADDNLFQC